MSTALAICGGSALSCSPDSPEFERGAVAMAREYEARVEAVRAHLYGLAYETQRLHAIFADDAEEGGLSSHNNFGLHVEHSGKRESLDCIDDESLTKNIGRVLTGFKRRAWAIMGYRLGLTNLMSVKRRSEWEHQVREGELPEICELSIMAVLLGLLGQAQDFAKEAAVEVFEILRPGKRRGGFKTNDAFRVGRRVILSGRVQRSWKGFSVSYYYMQEVTAIDGVFHLLDGKGVLKEHNGPLYRAIEAAGSDGKGETDYFRFKCFGKGTLHLEMKRLDLVKELNRLAVGEAVLGADGVEE